LKTVILGTVVSARKASPVSGISTFNDYREKFQQQSISCFPGFFPKEKHVLVTTKFNNAFSCRFTSAFPSDYHAEAQVMGQLT
jgi:polyribonucleotide nucleotidyltransferase